MGRTWGTGLGSDGCSWFLTLHGGPQMQARAPTAPESRQRRADASNLQGVYWGLMETAELELVLTGRQVGHLVCGKGH